jgi:Asp-tRNA(Asn)/Glu-tRNA(Gln) amidotransferase A subunit family amidase
MRISRICSPARVPSYNGAPRLPGGMRGLYETFLALMAACSAESMTEDQRHGFAAMLRQTGDWQDVSWAHGLTSTLRQGSPLRERQARYRAALRDFFADGNLLISPAAPVKAFPHDTELIRNWFSTITVNGITVRYNLLFFLPAMASLTGFPATVFPCGNGPASGLPIGLQVMGAPMSDLSLIDFAALLAREMGGFRPPPLSETNGTSPKDLSIAQAG